MQRAAVNQEPVGALVQSAIAGDPRAESALCERFAPAVRAFARRRLRDHAAVDEFCQDVMLLFVVAVRARKLADPERAGGFVLGICRNLARDRARSRDRRAALQQTLDGRMPVDEVYEPQPVARYEIAHLEDCLSQLSSRSRELVRFTYVEARPDAAIADALAVTEGNVRIMRHRTLKALRDCMAERVSWEGA